MNNKHSDIAYHFEKWNVAAGVCTISWIIIGENLAGAMKKRLSVVVQDHLFGRWTYSRIPTSTDTSIVCEYESILIELLY